MWRSRRCRSCNWRREAAEPTAAALAFGLDTHGGGCGLTNFLRTDSFQISASEPVISAGLAKERGISEVQVETRGRKDGERASQKIKDQEREDFPQIIK